MNPQIPSSPPLDLDQFRSPKPHPRPSRSRPKPLPRHRQGERFIKGPIPWNWLERAGRLRGRSLHVALLVWHQAAMKKSAEVAFCLDRGEELNLSRQATRRALEELQAAGLIRVQLKRGSCSIVEILEIPPEVPPQANVPRPS